jgi:Bacterial membrane protein YfhO
MLTAEAANRPKSLISFIKEKQVWLLILLGLLFFYAPLFGGKTLYFRDLANVHLLQKKRLIEYFANRELPLWDRYVQGGQSYIGHISGDPLYPSNILYFVLPLLTALNWDLVLHLIFCSLSAYALARVLGLNATSSFLTGIVYAYCGHTLSQLNFYPRLLVLPYLPLMILCVHLYFSKHQRLWFVFAAIAGALEIFAGAPEVAAIHFLVLLGWMTFYPYGQSITRRLKIFALLLFFCIGIASVQLFPTAEVISQSHRRQGFSYSFSTQWSVHPKRLVEAIVPGFLGFKDTLDQRTYWGRSIEDGANPFVLSLYFGFPLIFLAITGAFIEDSGLILSKRMRRYLLSLIVVGILLSLGRFLPGFYWLYQLFPPLRAFRYPVKFINLCILPMSLLAGYAVQVQFERGKESWIPTAKFIRVVFLMCAAIVLFSIAFYASKDFASRFQQFFFNSVNDFAFTGLLPSFLQLSGFCLATLLIYQYRKLRPDRNLSWFMAAIVTADLFIAGHAVNFTAPRKFFETQPPSVAAVSKELDRNRLYRVPVQRAALQAPSNDLIWGYRWEIEVLNKAHAAFYGIPIILNDDLDGLGQERSLHFKTIVESLPWPQKMPLLKAGGVGLILTEEQIVLPGLQSIATMNSTSSYKSYLYRNPAARRFFFVTQWQSVSSPDLALRQMTDPEFDPQKTAQLENVPSFSPGRNCQPAEMKLLQLRNNSSAYSISTKCDGYLIFTDPFFPGWQLRVDHQREPLVRANYAFSAGFIRAGTHSVEKIYRPFTVLAGAAISLLSALVLFAAGHRY